MTTSLCPESISRRAALAGLGGGGLALALAATSQQTAAQDATPFPMTGHPILGVWNVKAAPGPNVTAFFADGTAIFALPTTSVGPQGVQFVTALVGRWEPVTARGVRFTAVQLISDINGTFTGSATVDGHPVVSEDGQTLSDDAPETAVTIRDAAGTIVAFLPGPATAVRIEVGAPGFPDGTPTSGTPTG